MPEEYTYIPNSEPYGQFPCHTPIVNKWLSSTYTALSDKTQLFKVIQGTLTIKIEIHESIWTIKPNHTQFGKVSFNVDGPTSHLAILLQSYEKLDARIEFEDQTYFIATSNGNPILKDKENRELACLVNAWKDSDTKKEIKFWLHHQPGVPPLLLAILLIVAQSFDSLTNQAAGFVFPISFQ